MTVVLGPESGLDLDELAAVTEIRPEVKLDLGDISEITSYAIRCVYGEGAQAGYDNAMSEVILPEDYDKALVEIAKITKTVIYWNEAEDPLLIGPAKAQTFADASDFLKGIESISEE